MILLPLSQGRFALIDDCDADLAEFNWYAVKASKSFYAYRKIRINGRKTTAALHRVIATRMGIVGNPDHRNRGGLDNRRANLRAATPSQQLANQSIRSNNRSGFKGVSWDKGAWRVQIFFAGRKRHLGRFAVAADAARVYDAAAREAFGEYAFLNFPASEETTP